MFIKTLKYDFLFSREIFLGMAVVMMALSAILRFTVLVPHGIGIVNIPGVVFLVVIMLFGIMTVGQILQLFYKNFFDDTGYLMLTLPTKRFPLFASKVLVSFVWFNLMLLCALVSASILTSSRLSLGGINDAISLENFVGVLEVNLIAMFLILVIYLVITLAHSNLWQWRVNGIVAVVVGLLCTWLFFGIYAALERRCLEWITTEHSWPMRQYNALGEYIGTQYYHSANYFNRPIVGLDVGRIPFRYSYYGFHGFIDIYWWGIGFALCILVFFATYYLLKRCISL